MSRSRKLTASVFGIGGLAFMACGASAQVTYNNVLGNNFGPPEVDIASVVVSNDANNLNFQINLNPNANITTSGDYYPNYDVGIQVGNGANGQTLINGNYGTTTANGNPYGNDVGISTGENFFVGTYLAGPGYSGGAQLYSFDSVAGWTQLGATAAVNEVTAGTPSLAFSLPLSAFGFTTGSQFKFDVWATYGVPGGQSAYDALDNSTNLQAISGYFPYSNGAGTPTPYDSATAPGSTFNTTIYTVTTPTQNGTWNVAGSGSWTASGNWLNGVIPQNPGDTANFDNSITAPATVTLDANQSVGTLNFDSSISYTLAAGTGGILTLDNGGGAATVTDGGGTHFISAPVVLNSNTTITVTNSADTLQISGSISGTGGLTIAGSGKVALSGGASKAVTSLLVNSGATLDLTNSSLTIKYPAGNSPLSAIEADLASGSNGGKWNGTGIISSNAAAKGGSYAIGYADGSVDNGTPAGANQIFLRYDLSGDCNLDGTVNLTDLLAMLNNYGESGRDWAEGDMNYDGTVNLTDLLALLNNYGQTASLTSEPLGDARVVPEPAAMSVLSLAGAGFLARRRNPKKSGRR